MLPDVDLEAVSARMLLKFVGPRGGKRTPRTLLVRDECDHLLREAARLHCAGMSDREAARYLGTTWAHYQAGEGRPLRHARKLTAVLWCLLERQGTRYR
jgi:hypothetical protein